MSIHLVSWALAQKIDDALCRTLVALANRARTTEGCWPHIATIAADTGKSERTIKRHLAELERLGLIARKRLRYGCIYTFPAAPEVTPDVTSRRAGSHHPEVTPDGTPEVTPDVTSIGKKGKETTRATALVGAREARIPRRKPKIPIPKDFTLTSDRLNMGLRRGLTEGEVRHEFERFINSAHAHDRRYADWDRALDNWFDGEASGKFGPRPAALGANRPGSGSYFDAAVRVAARFAAQRLPGEPGDGYEDPLPF